MFFLISLIILIIILKKCSMSNINKPEMLEIHSKISEKSILN